MVLRENGWNGGPKVGLRRAAIDAAEHSQPVAFLPQVAHDGCAGIGPEVNPVARLNATMPESLSQASRHATIQILCLGSRPSARQSCSQHLHPRCRDEQQDQGAKRGGAAHIQYVHAHPCQDEEDRTEEAIRHRLHTLDQLWLDAWRAPKQQAHDESTKQWMQAKRMGKRGDDKGKEQQERDRGTGDLVWLWGLWIIWSPVPLQ